MHEKSDIMLTILRRAKRSLLSKKSYKIKKKKKQEKKKLKNMVECFFKKICYCWWYKCEYSVDVLVLHMFVFFIQNVHCDVYKLSTYIFPVTDHHIVRKTQINDFSII